MTSTSLVFLLIIATTEMMLVTKVAASPLNRQKRSDDADPLTAVVEHQSQQINSLNANLAALKARTDTLEKTVAFSATGGSGPITATGHGPILINQVHMNVGNAFDHETSFFTAPVSGLYQFTATFMVASLSSHQQVFADIVADGHTATHATSDSRHGFFDETDLHTIVHVAAGKKVYVRNGSPSSASYYGGTYLAFSGFLLRAD